MSYVNSSSVPEDIFVKLLITNTLEPHIIFIYYLDFKTSFLTNTNAHTTKILFSHHSQQIQIQMFFPRDLFHVVLNKYKYKIISEEDPLHIQRRKKMPKNTNMNKDTKIFHREISFTSLSTNTTTSTNLRTAHTFL